MVEGKEEEMVAERVAGMVEEKEVGKEAGMVEDFFTQIGPDQKKKNTSKITSIRHGQFATCITL